MTVLLIIFALVIANAAPTVIGSCFAKALGIGVPKISLGVWGPKFSSNLGHSSLVITPWQISSSFALKDRSTLDLYPDTPGRFFDDIHPLLRAFIAVVGPVLLLIATIPVLGTSAIASLTRGFPQIFTGALSPLSDAQELLAGFSQLATNEPLPAVAVLITKLVAFALLPLPPNACGSALLQLARWRRPKAHALAGALQQVGILVILVVAASWTLALLVFVARGGAI